MTSLLPEIVGGETVMRRYGLRNRRSARRLMDEPSFAAGVHRDEVAGEAELLGLEVDVHIANVIAALRPIAGDLGLPTE